MYKYFKTINSIGNISGWKSKGLSNENVKTPNFLNPLLNYVGTKIGVKFSGSLKQNAASYNHGTIVNIYFVYKIINNYNISSYPTLENSLFGAVNLTNMLILICTNILDMILDLIEKGSFHLVVMDLVEM